MGLEALMNWGPEKMLIRCSKETQHPAVDLKTSGWASKRTRKTQRDGHKLWRSKYEVYVRSLAPSHTQTLQIKWEVNIIVKKSSRVFILRRFFLRFPSCILIVTACVVYSCVCLWCCVVVMLNDDVDDYITCELNYHDQKIWRTLTHDIRKHWTAVSTLLCTISSVHHALHHWRSNQRPQTAEAKPYNWTTNQYHTQVTPN